MQHSQSSLSEQSQEGPAPNHGITYYKMIQDVSIGGIPSVYIRKKLRMCRKVNCFNSSYKESRPAVNRTTDLKKTYQQRKYIHQVWSGKSLTELHWT